MATEAVQKIEEDEAIQPKSASQLPEPTGYKILIALPEAEEKTAGGILKAEETIRIEETASVTGFVMAMGSDCYKDESKFPTGPWCAVGDYVMFRANTGTRFTIDGLEYRLMNDDSIEAVVADHRGIERV